jgi:cyanophycin synthetase
VNFGMGAQALAMHSSVTERTGALAVNRARDKAATRQFMAMLGIPVTEQRVARTMEQARQFVQSNGYPVVVKPRALDGGEGVTTEIRSDEALGQALRKVAALSQTALIERQLLGEEYRLLYVKGKLISVHERVPAHVAGNGRDTVQELVDAENVRRGAAAQTGFTNIPIHLGEDALNQLSAQGLDLSSIPETGRIVRLATVPRVRTGGAVRIAIDPSKIHPQILSDARNVVRMVGLDVAGVDIITPDLGKPLQETGGAITEVNAKPQIVRFEAFDVHARVLKALLNGNGRIPCVLILADNETAAPLLSVLADRQDALLESTGLLLADTDLSADVKARFGCVAALKGLPALLAHPDMCSIVAVAPMSHVVANGYPLDRSHLTVILDDLRRTQVAEMASPLLRPHIAGPIFLPSGTAAASAFSAAVPPMKYSTFDDIEFLSQQIAAVLRKGVTSRSDAIAAAGRP